MLENTVLNFHDRRIPSFTNVSNSHIKIEKWKFLPSTKASKEVVMFS